jgi:hypothetical protein
VGYCIQTTSQVGDRPSSATSCQRSAFLSWRGAIGQRGRSFFLQVCQRLGAGVGMVDALLI